MARMILPGAAGAAGVAAAVLCFALGTGMADLPNTAAARGVGVERLAIHVSPDSSLDALVFYPARAPLGTTSIGPYDVLGLANAAPTQGRFPLILISHGSGGNMLSHHALASHLAMNGFVVASLTHQGDNFRDSSGLGKASTAHSRARHVSMLLTAALDSAHGERIDPRQVGIIGYSAGSVTALMLAGASPDLGRLRGYCEDRAGRSGLCEARGVIVDDVDEASSTGDPRIKAALLLAPIGVLFAEQALEAVRLPVGLVAAHADEEVPPRTNAYALRSHLPEVIMVESVPGAGHSIFLAPCSDRLSAAFADLCKDPPYVDRQRVHAMMNDLVIAFFRYSLDREVARHGINAEPRGATAP